MFGSSGTFDKLLDKATSNLLMEPDWPSILQICDLVRQDDIQPKYAISALKKKLFSANPHTSYYALQVLESLIKNCGSSFHEELTLRINCDMLHDLAKTTQHENVRSKLLEIIQVCTVVFRKNPKYNALKEVMTLMKNEGYKFPTLRESEAMFSADTAPEWQDGDVCHRCRIAFNLVQRKHHCRNCGQIFCGQCSQKSISLPKFGFEKEVRVCDACYESVTKPVSAPKKSTTKQEESDLPAEYLNSSLSQQSQVPPRKTEEELREEEELQLALALSQSEAEAKEKQKFRPIANPQLNPKTEVRTERTPSPVEDQAAVNPELARYLNRNYWEKRQTDIENNRPTSPSAPSTDSVQSNEIKYNKENGLNDGEIQDFANTLKSQVEIFINRMKSNSSRGRSIANDSSVQTLFLNITAMHSQLLRYIQQHDDSRLYYEELQDKLTQVRDARAALDALRDEHREKLRREAEAAEVQRQLQMAHKLDIMRKKKQEYLQYQRQLALQRVQEQEREMQMRQEQQKQQYLMGSTFGTYKGSPVHGQFMPPGNMPSNMYRAYPYMQGVMMDVPQMVPGMPQVPPGLPQGLPQANMPQQSSVNQQGLPQNISSQGPPMVLSTQGIPAPIMSPQSATGNLQQIPPQTHMPPGINQQPHIPPGLAQQQSQLPPGLTRPPQTNIQQSHSQPSLTSQPPPQQGMLQQMPQTLASMGGPHSIPVHNAGPPMSLPPQMPPGMAQSALQAPGAPPANSQGIQNQQNGDAQTGELIILD